MCPKEYVNYQNKLYWIYRRVKQDKIKEGFVQNIKDYWDCDIVLKHRFNEDDVLLFLREIPELEILN
jgi:hypothetical protein